MYHLIHYHYFFFKYYATTRLHQRFYRIKSTEFVFLDFQLAFLSELVKCWLDFPQFRRKVALF